MAQRKSRTPVHERASHHGELAAIVSARREELGLRQDELAELADCSTRFVHTVESGKSTIQFGKLLAVLSALGLHLQVERGYRAGGVATGASLRDRFGLTNDRPEQSR